MAIPVIPIGAETFQQPNAYATNAAMLQNLYTSQIQNQYLPATLSAQLMHQQLTNQQLQPQAQLAPQMAQADLARAQVLPDYMRAQMQGILQGTIPMQQALGGMYGTEAGKNQFLLNNPGLMLPGMGQNLAGYAILQKLMPQVFGQPQSSSPGQDVMAGNNLASGNSTQLPGMPSMGNISPQNSMNGSILPNNPY